MQTAQVSEEIAKLLALSKAELEKHYAKVGRLYIHEALGLELAVKDAKDAKRRIDDLLTTQETIARVLRDDAPSA